MERDGWVVGKVLRMAGEVGLEVRKGGKLGRLERDAFLYGTCLVRMENRPVAAAAAEEKGTEGKMGEWLHDRQMKRLKEKG